MSSIIQFLVDEGVFEEDPGGVLWLSVKMKDAITRFEENEKSLKLIEEIEDKEQKILMRWTIIYLNFMGGITEKELTERVIDILSAWETAAKNKMLTEWSMKLRLL